MSDAPEKPLPRSEVPVPDNLADDAPGPEPAVSADPLPDEAASEARRANGPVPDAPSLETVASADLLPDEPAPETPRPADTVPEIGPTADLVHSPSAGTVSEPLVDILPDAAATEEPAPSGPVTLREPDEDLLRLAEALVFASAEPVTPRGLARVLPDDIDADAVLAALRQRYAGHGVELVDAGNGVMFRSALDLAPRLRKVIETPRRLPRVAMETLAIVAYHQPMTRPEIEHIRGTALSQQTLDALLELNLIAPKGRRETPGRPTLWGTTPEFLAHFGLKDLRELPRREDLLLETAPPRPTPEAIPADLQPPQEPADG